METATIGWLLVTTIMVVVLACSKKRIEEIFRVAGRLT